MRNRSKVQILDTIARLAFAAALLPRLCLGATAIIETDFESGLGPWQPLSEGAWELQETDGNTVAALVETGVDRPPVRRPQAYILLQGHAFLDFTMTARVQSLEPNTIIGRDVVVLFGYIDDTHYYYAHLANSSVGTYHNIIVKVSGDTRSIIQNEPAPEARLFDGWQDTQITRDTDGQIAVYMGDFETPIMTAHDTDYPLGSIGVGSFDGRALFDDIHVEGTTPDGLRIEPPTDQNAPSLHYTSYPSIPVTIESSTNLGNWNQLFGPITTESIQALRFDLPATASVPLFYRTTYIYPTPL